MIEDNAERKVAPTRVPPPAHPRLRREPLPWRQPKAPEEDPAAVQQVRVIIDNPSYRQADQDIDFLNRDDTRGPRLQIDYLKAELVLKAQDVEHTIVVFGSTRIPEPQAARRRVDALRASLAAEPTSSELLRRLAIAERLLAKSHYYDVAREFGRLASMTSSERFGARTVVMTGGGPGIMEAANRGAHDAGAKTIGLNITLPHEQYPNPYVTPGLCFRFHYFSMRKLHFVMRARALVAFPGGFGTLDELFEVLTLIQTRKIKPVPVILVGEAYWRRVFDPDFLVEEGVIDEEDRELFWYAETAQEILDDILHWHALSDGPLSAGA